MFRKYLFVIVCLAIPCLVFADTVYFKNGKSIKVERAWEEDGQIKTDRSGTVIGYPKNTVDRVENENDIQYELKVETEIFGIKWGEKPENVKNLSFEGKDENGNELYTDTSKKVFEGIPVRESTFVFCDKKLCSVLLDLESNNSLRLIKLLKHHYGAPKNRDNKNEKGEVTIRSAIWNLKDVNVVYTIPFSINSREAFSVFYLPLRQ